MKKILIFYVSVGRGHFKVAQVLKRAFLKRANLKVNIKDALAYVAWPLRFLYKNVYFFYISHWPFYLHWRRAYQRSKKITAYTKAWHWFLISCFLFLSSRLKKFILSYKPDLIVCVYPLPLELICIWKRKGEIKCPLISVITDLLPHPVWAFENVDSYYVATEEIKEQFIKYGLAEQKTKVTGIPLAEEFLKDLNKKEIAKKLNLTLEKKIILILCRRLSYSDLRKVLSGLKNLNPQVIVITEGDKKLKNLEQEKRKFSFPILIFDYTKAMAELMTIADVLVSKPGGIILSEAFCKRLPIIAFNPIPGHEEDNLKYLLSKKVALYARNAQEIINCIRLLLTSPEIMTQIQANLEKLVKTRATEVIVEDIIDKFLK